jgi:GNAT superfamily N-acetyltransferase
MVDFSKVASNTTRLGRQDNLEVAGDSPFSASCPGPLTTITRHTLRTLQLSGLIPQLFDLINAAFANSHSRDGVISTVTLRLQSEAQLVRELSASGTFTFVVTYTGTKVALGTASAKPHCNGSLEHDMTGAERSIFTRMEPLKGDVASWELVAMAVDPPVQRQGLAGMLMEMVEVELKRRTVDAKSEVEKPLVMLLSTVKEVNGDFYAKKGYMRDYETQYGPGCMGSEHGFTVIHMHAQLK